MTSNFRIFVQMPEITIKYKNSRTLKVLEALSTYLDFSLPAPSPKNKKKSFVNGVPVIPGDRSVDISDMEEIFTGKNLDAKKLRTVAWQRNK